MDASSPLKKDTVRHRREFVYVTRERIIPCTTRTDDIHPSVPDIDVPVYSTDTSPRFKLVFVCVVHMKPTRLGLDDIRRRSVNLWNFFNFSKSTSVSSSVCIVVDDDEVVMLSIEDTIHLGLPGLDQVVVFLEVGWVFPASTTRRCLALVSRTKWDHVEIPTLRHECLVFR